MSDLKNAILKRRSYYSLTGESTLSDSELKALVDFAVLNVPSAYNSQSSRLVLLLHENHAKLWNIVKESLREIVPEERFGKTEEKINNSFLAGYGTVLFFEDQKVIRDMQEKFPSYSDNFTVWSQHTAAMHQYAMWLLLEDAGMGASLQHYNPLIDSDVAKEWNLDPEWRLIAQMPFGKPAAEPGEKKFGPLEERSLLFE